MRSSKCRREVIWDFGAYVAAVKETTGPMQTLIVTYSVLAFIIGIIVIYLVTSLILKSSTIVVVIGYIIGIPMILAAIGGLLQSLDSSVGLSLPLKISPLYILARFIVMMFSHEVSKWMCRKKVNAVPMSDALKSGME